MKSKKLSTTKTTAASSQRSSRRSSAFAHRTTPAKSRRQPRAVQGSSRAAQSRAKAGEHSKARRPRHAPAVPLALSIDAQAHSSPPALPRPETAAPALPPLHRAPPTIPSAASPARTERSIRIPPILLEGDERTAPVSTKPAEKYALGPAEPAAPPAPVEGELPAAYGTGKLFLTARDPHCLYAHWDLTEAQQRHHQALAQKLVLRVYPENRPGAPVAETVVHPEARHGFVRVEQAGAKYWAQLGGYQPGGEWVPLATSEPTATPPASVAPDKTLQWATVPPPAGIPAPAEAESNRAPLAPTPRQPPQPSPRLVPLAGVEGKEFPLAFAQAVPPESAPLRTARPAVAGARPAAAEWTAAQERVLAEMVETALAAHRTVGSAEIAELVTRRMGRELGLPAAPVPLGPPVAPPNLVPLQELLPELVAAPPLEISSPVGGPPPRREFWLNLNVELVVYGATEPGAQVTLGGQVINLRPDGTFSCRFALPDGQFDLPVRAVSGQAEVRGAQVSVERRTDYQGEVGMQPAEEGLRPPE